MIDFLLLPALMIGASWFLGWWGILLVGLVWGFLRRGSPSWRAGLAAAVAWTLWLILAGPPLAMVSLLEKLSELFGVPTPVLVVLPPLYAAVLGWASARLCRGLTSPLGHKGGSP